MNISFTGLENVVAYRTKDKSSEFLNTTIYTISGSLTNDGKGYDKDKFYSALKKSGSDYEWRCNPRDLEDAFLFQVSEINFPDKNVPPLVYFGLNGARVNLNNDRVLPIFSFIGQTLSKMKEQVTDKYMLENIKKFQKLLTDEMMKYMRV